MRHIERSSNPSGTDGGRTLAGQLQGWVIAGVGILCLAFGALLNVHSFVALVSQLLGVVGFGSVTLKGLHLYGGPTQVLGAVALGLGLLLIRYPDLLTPPVQPIRHPIRQLILVSVLALFFEVLMIRWLASEIRLLGYFKNMTLICSFLGLGVGCGLATAKRDSQPLFIVILGLLVFLGATVYARALNHIPIPAGGTGGVSRSG